MGLRFRLRIVCRVEVVCGFIRIEECNRGFGEGSGCYEFEFFCLGI